MHRDKDATVALWLDSLTVGAESVEGCEVHRSSSMMGVREHFCRSQWPQLRLTLTPFVRTFPVVENRAFIAGLASQVLARQITTNWMSSGE